MPALGPVFGDGAFGTGYGNRVFKDILVDVQFRLSPKTLHTKARLVPILFITASPSLPYKLVSHTFAFHLIYFYGQRFPSASVQARPVATTHRIWAIFGAARTAALPVF